jgi:hypothetical protein
MTNAPASMNSPAVRKYLTTQEAADVLRMKPGTLYKWASSGTGPIVPEKVGGKLVWPVLDIAKALNTSVEDLQFRSCTKEVDATTPPAAATTPPLPEAPSSPTSCSPAAALSLYFSTKDLILMQERRNLKILERLYIDSED